MAVKLILSTGIEGALVYLFHMRSYYAINRYYVLLLFLECNAIIHALVMYNSKMFLFCVQERISDGDWETLYCFLNAVAKVHLMGPILLYKI